MGSASRCCTHELAADEKLPDLSLLRVRTRGVGTLLTLRGVPASERLLRLRAASLNLPTMCATRRIVAGAAAVVVVKGLLRREHSENVVSGVASSQHNAQHTRGLTYLRRVAECEDALSLSRPPLPFSQANKPAR